ncbi:hypothetical protein [Streptomyces sp. SID3343]|uniref:hypothetical protein n=1 Tax=Streptomyces sp. SID3343 TaxID=2690260 RepID=UPI001371278D|nr:hypothetical protein [Streptomyces sp. SID3343]MYV98288.1 hypothetical protein [Streptomyces sp. SID3343]MYW04841.1 hypothetical protein [Streptomyces sp. SID3343]
MEPDVVTVVESVTGSRGLAWCRHRFGRGTDRVLVAEGSAYPSPTLAEVRRAGRLWWVAAREHAQVLPVVLCSPVEGSAHRVEVQLHWWVHDPRTIANRRPVNAFSFVRRDVESRLRKAAAGVRGADEGRLQDELDAALAHPATLPEYGLSYRSAGLILQSEEIPGDVQATVAKARWAVPLEIEEQRLMRARLDFHRELIREGPEALIAYWLTQFPEQIRAVLDYLDAHRPTESPDRTLSTEILALLADADDFERNQLRKSIVAGLAGSGPRGLRVIEELGLLERPEDDEDRR